jgi:hypothetical protein
MGMRRVVLALAALLIVAACTGGSDQDVRPTTATPSASPAAEFRVVGSIPSTVGSASVHYYGLLDDKTAYGFGSQSLHGAAKYGPVLTNLRSRRITWLHQIASGDDAGYVIAAPGYVVWMELDSNWDDLTSWTLYSYERATRVVRKLAVAPADQHTHNIHQLQPSISDGVVYLSAVASSNSNDPLGIGAAYSVPVDGSSPLKRLVRGSVFAQASDGYLFFDQHGYLQKRDLSSGLTIEVAKTCRPDRDECHWGVGGGALVWNPGMDGTGEGTEPDAMNVLEADGTHFRADSIGGDDCDFVASATWVTCVDEYAPGEVYSIPDRKVLALPDGWHMSSVSGNAMVWSRGHGTHERYQFIRLR